VSTLVLYFKSGPYQLLVVQTTS